MYTALISHLKLHASFWSSDHCINNKIVNRELSTELIFYCIMYYKDSIFLGEDLGKLRWETSCVGGDYYAVPYT